MQFGGEYTLEMGFPMQGLCDITKANTSIALMRRWLYLVLLPMFLETQIVI